MQKIHFFILFSFFSNFILCLDFPIRTDISLYKQLLEKYTSLGEIETDMKKYESKYISFIDESQNTEQLFTSNLGSVPSLAKTSNKSNFFYEYIRIKHPVFQLYHSVACVLDVNDPKETGPICPRHLTKKLPLCQVEKETFLERKLDTYAYDSKVSDSVINLILVHNKDFNFDTLKELHKRCMFLDVLSQYYLVFNAKQSKSLEMLRFRLLCAEIHLFLLRNPVTREIIRNPLIDSEKNVVRDYKAAKKYKDWYEKSWWRKFWSFLSEKYIIEFSYEKPNLDAFYTLQMQHRYVKYKQQVDQLGLQQS